METIDLQPVRAEVVSARRFLKLMRTEGHNILSASVIPPRLGRRSKSGRRDRGRIQIYWRNPVYAFKPPKRAHE